MGKTLWERTVDEQCALLRLIHNDLINGYRKGKPCATLENLSSAQEIFKQMEEKLNEKLDR